MSTQPNKLDVTLDELRYIHAQFKDILDDKLSLHLPQAEDNVRQEVQLQLQNFLFQVMDMAEDSLNIVDDNRTDNSTKLRDVIIRTSEKNVEPFDLELNEKVRKMYQEWEDETVKVAQLRRDGPRKLKEKYKIEEKIALDEIDSKIARLKNQKEEVSKEIPEEENDEEDAEYWKSLAHDFEDGLSNLQEAQSSLPTNRNQLKKLKKMVLYLENEVTEK